MQRNTAIVVAVAVLAFISLFAMPLLAFAFGLGGMPRAGWTWRMPMHDGWGGFGNVPVWFAIVGVVSQFAFFALLAAGA